MRRAGSERSGLRLSQLSKISCAARRIRLFLRSAGTVHAVPEVPAPIRKLVHTTNAIESLNSRFRQSTRPRDHFPNEQAALKVLYLVIRNPLKKRQNITGKIAGWKDITNTLALFYGEQIMRITGNSYSWTRVRN